MKPCPYLVVLPQMRGMEQSKLVCSIPAYQDADTQYCDEWVMRRGEIVPIEGEGQDKQGGK